MSGFNINTVTISGNLTRDPELKTFNSGATLCEVSIAVNERVKGQDGEWGDRASFFDVKIWKGVGEWVARSLSKGDGLAVSGRLHQERWETDGGEKRSKVVIVADSIMPRSGEGGGGSSSPRQQTDVPVSADDMNQPVAAGVDDDSIPF